MTLSKYRTASQRLLSYAELNREDSDFDFLKREIIYIFDTSVIEAYWRRQPDSMDGRYGTNALLQESVAQYSGWLALKFLMEHRLPGQKKRSAFVSPAHWNETIDRVYKLEQDSRGELRVATVGDLVGQGEEEAGSRIDEMLRLLSLTKSPDQLLKEAGRLGVGKTFLHIMQSLSRAERVRRTFRNGRNGQPSIRDLTFCPFYNDLPGPKFRHSDFRRWQAAIGRHRKKYEVDRKLSETLQTRNIDNDAMTLASIQAMYRGSAEIATRSTANDAFYPPVLKFVFVTADAAIHDAFQELQEQMEGEGIPAFLRHPHVYSPLLNHANMSQTIKPREFAGLRTVFDRVEEALEPLSNDYNPHSSLMQGYERKLEYNVSLWSRNVETICLANSHYVVSDASGEYFKAAELARILSTPNVRAAAAASVSADIGTIRDDHLQMMSLLALEKLETARISASHESEEHRAPVKLIGVDIAEELGFEASEDISRSGWLDALLRDFRNSEAINSTDALIDKLRANWEDDRKAKASLLLASCIFFAVNSWYNAKLCAELCQRRISRKRRTDVWLREARYCEALAIRMQLRSAADLREATSLLTENILGHTDILALARDRVERATLNMTAIIVQVVEATLPLEVSVGENIILYPVEACKDDFANFLDELSDQSNFLENFLAIGEGDVSMALRIRVQAEINIFGAQIFSRLLGDALLHDEDENEELYVYRDRLLSLLQDLPFAWPTSAQVYLIICDAICGGSSEASRAALDKFKLLFNGRQPISLADETENRLFLHWLEMQVGKIS